jgi:hypothetical protein
MMIARLFPMASKFTAEQREQILSTSREYVAKHRANRNGTATAEQPEPVRRRDQEIVFKTTMQPEAEPQPVEPQSLDETLPKARPGSQWDLWWQELDQRVQGMIDSSINNSLEGVGEFIADERQHLYGYFDKHLGDLRREIAIVRDEAAIERKLGKLRKDVERAERRLPNYEGELKALRTELAATNAELDKTRKILGRERANASVLKSRVEDLETRQRQQGRTIISHTETNSTLSVDIDTDDIGTSTRAAMERLHAAKGTGEEPRTIFAWRIDEAAS